MNVQDHAMPCKFDPLGHLHMCSGDSMTRNDIFMHFGLLLHSFVATSFRSPRHGKGNTHLDQRVKVMWRLNALIDDIDKRHHLSKQRRHSAQSHNSDKFSFSFRGQILFLSEFDVLVRVGFGVNWHGWTIEFQLIKFRIWGKALALVLLLNIVRPIWNLRQDLNKPKGPQSF